MVYKLDRNIAQNIGDITSYSKAVNNIYKRFHPEIPKKTQKRIEKIYKELGTSKLTEEKEKIRAIENYLKSNFQIVEGNYQELEDLNFILDNKTTSEKGILILQLQLLALANIKNEIVLTCDRSDLRFDEKFEAYLYLDEYLLYFPTIKEFNAPTNKFLRGRFIPDLLSHNYGLFIKEISVGEMKTAIGKIKFIEALPYSDSKDIMDIKVDFSKNQSMPKVEIKKTSTGYSAQYFQPIIYLLDEEAMDNIKQSLVEGISEQMKADEIVLINTGENDFGDKPFYI